MKFAFRVALSLAIGVAPQIGACRPGSGLVKKANVIEADGRRQVDDLVAVRALHLSDDEVLQMRKSSGYVICPGTTYGNPQVVSGALVHSEGVVVTAAHAFVDDNGVRREPLSSCYFRNQMLPEEIVPLSFAEGDHEINWNNREQGCLNDIAVVKLARPLANAKAFPLLRPFPALTIGQNILTVSATMERPDRPFDVRHPIVQSCAVRDLFSATSERGLIYYGDCDMSKGSSGSLNLVRDGTGTLAFVGMSIGSGTSERDGMRYSVADQSYSVSIAATDKLLAAILKVSGKP